MRSYKMNFITMLFIIMFCTGQNSADECPSVLRSSEYLDQAVYFLKQANDYCSSISQSTLPRDCYDILKDGHRHTSGIYEIWPQNRVLHGNSIKVYCDMDTDKGGWTVIQRRGSYNRPDDYFYKDWESYKQGFGDLDEDFWLGNDNIFAISNQKEYSVRFDLKDIEGEERHAVYDHFWIDDAFHKYMLHIKDYKGDAGDSMYSNHNKQKFSTKDQNNDKLNQTNSCAISSKGGWWYNACHDSNLNGLYLRGKHESNGDGVNWRSWKGIHESLKETEIKLKPKHSMKDY